MEEIFFSEMSVETQRATRRNIPEDVTACRFSLNLLLPLWIWRRYVRLKRRLKHNRLNGVIFQRTLLLVGFRWTYFFHAEDCGFMLLRNVGRSSTVYMSSYSRRRYCLSDFAELNYSILKMEAIFSSEPSVQTQRDTRRHITEDGTPCRISLNIFFSPEGGSVIFLRNVGWNWTCYTASYCRRWYCLPVFAELIYSALKCRRYVPPKHRLKLNGLQGVMF
jgi:hypothetical protein